MKKNSQLFLLVFVCVKIDVYAIDYMENNDLWTTDLNLFIKRSQLRSNKNQQTYSFLTYPK